MLMILIVLLIALHPFTASYYINSKEEIFSSHEFVRTNAQQQSLSQKSFKENSNQFFEFEEQPRCRLYLYFKKFEGIKSH